MRLTGIGDAFGTAPDAFRTQVNQMIDRLEDEPMKKRYKLTTILAAALIAALLGTAAVAAYQGRLAEMFKSPEDGLANEAVVPGIQEMHETYEGSAVRCTVQEALYDGEGRTFALGWELFNLTGESDLYVVCDGALFGGEPGDWRTLNHVSEFFLPMEATQCTLIGELPENDSSRCALSLSVLRVVGPYTMEEDGYIAVDDALFGTGEEPALYSDALVASGSFEIADRFTLDFNMDAEKLSGTVKRLVGENDYAFDGCEVHVTFGEISATAAHIVVEYISDEEILDYGKGIGPNYEFTFSLPDGNSWWSGNAGGVFGDPVRLDDGRWKSVYDYQAIELFTQPDALVLTFVTYPVVDGTLDFEHPEVRSEDAITLRFE